MPRIKLSKNPWSSARFLLVKERARRVKREHNTLVAELFRAHAKKGEQVLLLDGPELLSTLAFWEKASPLLTENSLLVVEKSSGVYEAQRELVRKGERKARLFNTTLEEFLEWEKELLPGVHTAYFDFFCTPSGSPRSTQPLSVLEKFLELSRRRELALALTFSQRDRKCGRGVRGKTHTRLLELFQKTGYQVAEEKFPGGRGYTGETGSNMMFFAFLLRLENL